MFSLPVLIVNETTSPPPRYIESLKKSTDQKTRSECTEVQRSRILPVLEGRAEIVIARRPSKVD